MDTGDLGESSSRKKTIDDKMSEGERPLKKAKYPWQVKGKCRSKGEGGQGRPEEMETNTDTDQAKLERAATHETPSSTNNLEILGDYLLKKDFNIPPGDSTDSDEKSDMEEEDVDALDLFPGPGPDSLVNSRASTSASGSSSSLGFSLSSSSSSESHSHPGGPSLVEDKNVSIDTYIARWQARQIAKGFVDNTINRVLDSWLVAPLPQTYDDTHNLALDVAEFFDNLPANNAVENEGILMAISAHGLQNNQNNSRNTNEQRAPCRNYGTRVTTAISECLSRNENPNISVENQEPVRNSSTEAVNNVSQSECLSDEANRKENNADINNVCQPIPTTSSSPSSSASIRLDHRKSHSENELSSSLVENRSSNSNANILNESSWRPLPQICSCSHASRRTNVSPNIPFHKRDSHSLTNNMMNHCSNASPQHSIPSVHLETECQNNIEASGDISQECVPPIPAAPSPEPLQSVDDNQEFEDHFDFMDAAVSFAIQKKGLTSFSSVDYG